MEWKRETMEQSNGKENSPCTIIVDYTVHIIITIL